MGSGNSRVVRVSPRQDTVIVIHNDPVTSKDDEGSRREENRPRSPSTKNIKADVEVFDFNDGSGGPDDATKMIFFSAKSYDKDSFNGAPKDLRDLVNITFFDIRLDEKTVAVAAGYEVVCVFVNDHCNALVIERLAAGGTKLICLRCAGFNNVDLAAAKRHNIKVARVPAYSPYAVAEHAIALMMTLNRKTHKAYEKIRHANFSLIGQLGFDMFGKTIGVVGTGKIGFLTAKRLMAFEATVLCYDVYQNEELKTLGCTYVSLDELMARSDVITLHCPLMPQTHHMINETAIAKMKDGVMLINTSRGGLMDFPAVLHGLKTRKIGYLGIDVYENEAQYFFQDLSNTVIEDDTLMRLTTFPNVLITAHQAFFTRDALNQIASTTLRNVEGFMNGGVLPKGNEVTET